MKSDGKEKKEKGVKQELTGELAKRIQVENLSSIWDLFTDSWGWQSFVSSCDVFTCLFALDPQNEISTFFCYSAWLACLLAWVVVEKCAARQKENGKRVFKNEQLLVSLLRLAGLSNAKSLKRFWPYFMGFRATSRPISLNNYIAFDVFSSGFMFMPSVCKIWDNLSDLVKNLKSL